MKKKVFTAFIASFIFSIFPALCEQIPTKVKVGYFECYGFQQGSEEGQVKSGYGYEFLQHVAAETGWTYEYDYDSWAQLWNKLLTGEIDILAGVLQSPERNNQVLFPDILMGFEDFYIYKNENDESIQSYNLSTLNNKTIGVVENTLPAEILKNWLKKNGISAELIFFDSFTSRDQAFKNREIDATVGTGTSVDKKSGFFPVAKFYNTQFYLAVSKKRPDLLKELNSSLRILKENKPFLIMDLQKRYYSHSVVSGCLGSNEQEYLKSHPVLKIGYIDDYLPFSDEKKGNPEGLIVDVISQISTVLNLSNQVSFEFECRNNARELFEMLKNGEIDAVFPVYKNQYFAEQNNFLQSDAVCASVIDMIYNGDFTDDTINSIAVSPHSPMQLLYVERHFPESKIVNALDAPGCLDAVKNGRAGCTFFSSYRTAYFTKRFKYRNLNSISITGYDGYCFSVRNGNKVLLNILNRGLSLIDEDAINLSIYDNTNSKQDITLVEFFQDHLVDLAFIILVVILLVILFLQWHFKKVNLSNEEMRKQFLVVRGLSRDYSNIFVIDLKNQTFTVEKLNSCCENLLSSDVAENHDYLPFVKKYTEERVLQEDKKAFLNASKLELIGNELSKNDNYSFNYRIVEYNEIHTCQCIFFQMETRPNLVIMGFKNIDELVKETKERELQKVLSENDGLTGVMNQGNGEKKVRQLIENGISGMLCVINLDNFKSLNDGFGHKICEKVLIKVAECLKQTFRDDDIIYRSGGDEFIVLVPELRGEDMGHKIAERLLAYMNAIRVSGLKKNSITVSVGAILFTGEQNLDFNSLYEKADSCVCKGKLQEGNSVIFYK